jgi:hypothetical protein
VKSMWHGAAAAALLIPVFWQSRVQSADLASHLYNAWLALRLERGEVSGLFIAPQTTNILFDLLLVKLLSVFSPGWTERIAVSLSVLLFAGGAWAVVKRVAGRFPPYFLALLAMLSYGFVFRLGLFNFYLGMGLALWALSLLWPPVKSRGIWIALPLAVLCWTCHALPFVWLVSVAGYAHLASRLSPRRRPWLMLAAMALVALLALFVHLRLSSQWLPGQPLMTTGADQAMVYGVRYKYLVFAWVILQASLLLVLVERAGTARLLFSVPFQICLLHAMVLAVVPTYIWIPGYDTPFSMFAERMGLAQGVMALLLLGRVRAHRLQQAAAVLLAAVFFVWSYQDSARLNTLEDLVVRAVQPLPRDSRVLSGLCYAARFNYAYHLLDRACIGRCASYGNYEPSTTQFRLRARPGNGIVSASRADTDAMEFGHYRVKAEDEPLYLVDVSCSGVELVTLRAGDTVAHPCAEGGQRR